MSSLITPLTALLIVVVLYLGFDVSDDYYITPEYGVGYALGIIGGLMMLALLIYPLRKHFKFLNHILTLKKWFKIHMMLGILGPVLILFHCNFSLGSANGNAALISMCLMVGSGLIGRYLYTKIHAGLYGNKITLKELSVERNEAVKKLNADFGSGNPFIGRDVFHELKSFEQKALAPTSILGSLQRLLVLGYQTRVTYRTFIKRLRQEERRCLFTSETNERVLKNQMNLARAHISLYLVTVRNIAELSFYERLFSVWHLLHLPLFFLLVITGFIHVYAVHVY